MPKKAIIVCGSRDSMYHKDPFYREQIFHSLDVCRDLYHFDLVVTGGQTGVDTVAKEWADCHSIENKSFYADWQQYGKAAGPIRNKKMLDEMTPEIVIAFPGGLGTASMKALARSIKCPVVELPLSDDRSEYLIIPKKSESNNLSLTSVFA
jgi:hypothetical protein